MTILLVDSDKRALDREAKRLADQQSAAMVVLHSNANDALKFAMYHDVHIVFTRPALVEMSGQELIEKILRFKPEVECHMLAQGEEVPLVYFLGKDKDAFRSENVSDSHTKMNDTKGEMHTIKNKKRSGNDSPQEGQKKGDTHMTERQLRSLGRKELLEMMIEQGKELEFVKSEHAKDLEFVKAEHEKEINALKQELEKARAALQNREIAINEAGSIAVAALQINGIFEAAQAASQQYIENIRTLNDRQAALCAQREEASRAEAERRLRETAAKCKTMEAACRDKCAAMERDAQQRSEAYWTEVSKRLQSFYENHQELKKLLGYSIPGIQI